MTLTRLINNTRVFFRKMSVSPPNTLAPVGVRGMKSLDRERFSRKLNVAVLKVAEDKLSNVVQLCKPYFLKLEQFKPVQNSSDAELLEKHIFLNPNKVNQWTDITEKDRIAFKQHGVDENNLCTKDIVLTYDNWRLETIFKSVLPENEEMVSSYSLIGHIIHLNLRDHLLEYKPIIGQVFLDKIKTCKTVVNKNNIIDNTYRNFSMEVIAGEEDFFVTVKENCCTFQFDFSKVYWNPRLGMEHERILGYLKPEDILFDVFCGVGPFSVPAAKRKTKVYANDLNPDSFKWLNHNSDHNKVKKAYFQSYNLDGKEFILTVFKDFIQNYLKGEVKIQNGSKIHVTMNLPALAVEFIRNFKGLIQEQELRESFDLDITVYLYCFAVGDDPVAVARKMVNENMGIEMSPYITDVFDVRNVSPKKEMMRVSFKLTKDVIFHSADSDISEPPKKKQCT